MNSNIDADVAIVGFGPSGLIAALTLAKYGVSAVVLERDHAIYPRARAVTVNDWTMRIFQALGVKEAIASAVTPQYGLRWVTYDGKEIMRMNHPPSRLGSKARCFDLYQPTLEARLRECAVEKANLLDIRFGHEVQEITQDTDGVTVIGRNLNDDSSFRVRSRYLFGCDGGGSTVRDQLHIAMSGDTLPVLWIVIDCRVKRWWPDMNIPTFWSDNKRPVVDLPVPEGNHRWELPLAAHEHADDFPTQKEVWPLLEAMGVTRKDVDIHRHAFYHHHVRMADTWRRGRCFLMGDAAHLMPPWAGAGMQTGIRDAHDISWKLAWVLNRKSTAGLLETYERERKPSAGMYTDLAVSLGKVIRQELSAAERAELDQASADPAHPAESPLTAPPVLAGGWLRGARGEGSVIGRMLPQPNVSDHRGVVHPLDDLLGDGFSILGDNVEPQSMLRGDVRGAWDALGCRYVPVRSKDQYTQGPHDIVDTDDLLLPWMRRYGVRAIAVRPDKFVAGSDVGGLEIPVVE